MREEEWNENLELINRYGYIEEGIAHIDLKLCGISKAMAIASKLASNNQSFRISFVKKSDEKMHVLTHLISEPEFMTDKDGKKWKRIL